MAEQIFVQIRFQIETELGTYSDTLYFTQEEYAALSHDEIIVQEQARADKWVAFVKEQSQIITPDAGDE